MTDPKYDRFRRLERPRADGPAEQPRSPGTDTRIEAVEGPDAAAPAADRGGEGPPASGGDLERFRTPAERPLELDLPGEDAQPFLRCASCETDSARTAARCTTCGADLDTEPQREFNRRFWAGRKAEAAAEAEVLAARQAARDAERVDEGALRRQAGESLAREVGAAERRRLEREGFGPDWGGGSVLGRLGDGEASSTPWALRWLRTMTPTWALSVGLLLLGLPVLLFLLFPPLGVLAGAVTLALFTPPRWRTRFGNRFGP